MYSLLKGYGSKKPKDGEESIDVQNSSQEPGSVVEIRSRRQLEPPSTSATGYGGGYLTWGWNTVAYLGGQIKKGINKSLDWDTSPQIPEIEAVAMATKSSGSKGKRSRTKPDGSVEYTVNNSDSLAKIALKFDTTPSELTRLNRLPSHMLFPGQVLFVPDYNKSEVAADKVSSSESITTTPQPTSLQNGNNKDKVNGSFCEHGRAKIQLTKTVSISDEEEEISEHFLKIMAKYITDGQGVVSGVLLVTPHSVMFNPNVSDPLVLERGRDVYCINTPMSAITSAAMYRDIAAMAIHDPLKHGRFFLDAATAESLSRQNSLEVDLSPIGSPLSSQLSTTLDNIEENVPSEENTKDLPDKPGSHSKRVWRLSDAAEPTPIAIDRGLDRTPTEKNKDFNQQQIENRNITENEGLSEIDQTEVELINIVNEILNDVIAEVISGTCSQDPSTKRVVASADNISIERDTICASPVSEDSGISCTAGSKTNEKCDNVSNPGSGSRQGCDKRLSETSDHDISQDSFPESTSSAQEKQASSSLLSSFSGEVKYWLGLGQRYSKEDEEEIVPRPASSNPDIQPLYLCIRISKKHWCICLADDRHAGRKGEDLVNRDRRRREYWFAIPPSRVEHVYGFFKQWCPSIHNSMSEEESDDEEHTLDTSTELEGDEAMQFVDVFFGCTPPKPKVEPFRLTLDTRDPYKHSVTGVAGTPDSLSEDLVFLPDMSSESHFLTEKMIKMLSSCLPSRTIGHSWVLVYSTFVHGFSLKTLYRNMEYYDDLPMLTVIKDDEQQLFGALSSCPLHISEGFYGTGESFLFKFEEDHEIKTYRWTGDNNFFMKGSKDCLAFGSGGGHFGLWLDEDFYHGTSSRSETYGNDRLSNHEDFLCSGLETWTFV